jgi:hypothetical protein
VWSVLSLVPAAKNHSNDLSRHRGFHSMLTVRSPELKTPIYRTLQEVEHGGPLFPILSRLAI